MLSALRALAELSHCGLLGEVFNYSRDCASFLLFFSLLLNREGEDGRGKGRKLLAIQQ